jgi:transcriptional regulator with XRE-family HTH domain
MKSNIGNTVIETESEFADAKAIREGLGMSQAVFSRAYGILFKTLQHWEQRRHNPDRTASAYLWTIEGFPDQVREAQQRHQMQQPAEIEQRPGLKGEIRWPRPGAWRRLYGPRP